MHVFSTTFTERFPINNINRWLMVIKRLLAIRILCILHNWLVDIATERINNIKNQILEICVADKAQTLHKEF